MIFDNVGKILSKLQKNLKCHKSENVTKSVKMLQKVSKSRKSVKIIQKLQDVTKRI